MAWLLNPETGDRQYLAQRSLIGRAAHCWLRIGHRSVSAEHAVVYFDADGWRVKDLGSRNGTWVEGKKLDVGSSVRVGTDSVLQFGDVAAKVVGVDPPALCARGGPRHECVVADNGVLALPDEDSPQATVYEAAPGRWVADIDGATQELEDGDVLLVDGARYQVHVPRLDAVPAHQRTVATKPQLVLAESLLRLEVSRDEEAIVTKIVHDGQVEEIPARTSHQVLLLLAKQRLADRRDNLEEAECGWVYSDEMPKMLGYDRERINVDIHRLRQQFAKAGAIDAAQLIERRPTTHQLRLGVPHVELV